MNNLLFLLQQLFLPVWAMLPIWFGFVVAFCIISFTKFRSHSVWILRLGTIFLAAVLLIKLFLLLTFPYGQRQSSFALNNPELANLPLYVVYLHGDIHVTHNEDSESINLSSKDVSNGYLIERSTVDDVIDGVPVKIPTLYLHRKTEATLISQIKSEVNLTIPSTFSNREKYVVYDTTGVLDFATSQAPEVNISLNSSKLDMYFTHLLGNKKYTLKGGSRSSGRLYIPDGPTYVITDNFSSVISYPSAFMKIGEKTYKKEGDANSIVTIDVSVNMAKTLEVITSNEHNE